VSSSLNTCSIYILQSQIKDWIYTPVRNITLLLNSNRRNIIEPLSA
jgi:hypothetical protein